MLKIIAFIVLVVTVMGMAHWIELSARPPTGRQGVRQEGGHEH